MACLIHGSASNLRRLSRGGCGGRTCSLCFQVRRIWEDGFNSARFVLAGEQYVVISAYLLAWFLSSVWAYLWSLSAALQRRPFSGQGLDHQRAKADRNGARGSKKSAPGFKKRHKKQPQNKHQKQVPKKARKADPKNDPESKPYNKLRKRSPSLPPLTNM